MKKYAIIAAIAAAFFGITAVAEAGYYTQRVVGYDHCGRPIIRTVYVETCQPRYYSSQRSYGRSYYSSGSSCNRYPSYSYGGGYRSRCR